MLVEWDLSGIMIIGFETSNIWWHFWNLRVWIQQPMVCNGI